MLATLTTWASDVLAIVGLLLLTIAVYGMVRMPDTYARLHAASKAVFLGLLPLLLAACLTGDRGIITRAILITAFLLLTTPVSSHAIARAAYLEGETIEPLNKVGRSTRASSTRPTEPPSEPA
jgi:multicomponent Na+:H+ antiporter subunit G